MNPGELALELFCRGVRLAPSFEEEPAGRPISRTRAGLGSGLELVVPGGPPTGRDVWCNAPVLEKFVPESPFVLERSRPRGSGGVGGPGAVVRDERSGARFPVRLPPEPAWYGRRTARGTEMRRVGVLQGTYLGVYVSRTCLFWTGADPVNCRFCTTGANVGVSEEATKHVDDVVETAQAAKRESGVTFVHLNTGYQGGKALVRMERYVRALKERVGVLVGVQAVPEGPFEQYDRLIEAGCDHFSFCVEFQDPETFRRICPGKHEAVGQERFFEALAYCQKRLPRGACSGEIIAGIEPVGATLKAIDRITALGAFPTVCIFRPLLDSAMEAEPSPEPAEMRRVMRRVWEACRDRRIPIGLAPNIEVSLILQPADAAYFSDWTLRDRWYWWTLGLKRRLARPVFRRKMALRA